jgi:hypothetical protein
MIGVTVAGVEHVRGNLARARTGVRTAQERGVARASVLVSRMLREELTGQAGSHAFWGKTGAKDGKLAVRTGHTRASITPGGNVIRVGDNVVAAVGSGSESLKRHEAGGTFRGTSPGGYFRVPTREAQTAAGVDRWMGMSIRNIPGAFLLRTHAGRLWAAVGTKNRLTLLYLLVKSITLAPRRIFQRTRTKAQPQCAALVGNAVSLVVREANK